LYTTIESAKLFGVDPKAWLADVLARIADHPVPWTGRPPEGARLPSRPPDRISPMRAVLCSAFTGPEDLEIADIEEAKPAGDEILTDVHAASVSFMDQLLVSRGYQMRPQTPLVPRTLPFPAPDLRTLTEQ
jgi:hypothetical protein